MGPRDVVFYTAAFSALLQGVSCVCLLSRMEYHPCTYRKPATTAKPGNNEVGEYMTRYQGDRCVILRRRHRVKALPRISSGGGTIFYLYSPGKRYFKRQNYFNQNLMVANVNCTSGQFIYFQLLDMNLENTKCYDTRTARHKCVDYLQVRTPSGSIISDNCGRDTSNLNGVILPFDSIQVVFRSDHRLRYPGFSATATCFRPSPPPTNCVSQRRTSARRPAPVNQCQASTHDEIRIPFGHHLAFNGRASYSTLNVVNRETNSVTNRYHKSTITSLQFLSVDSSTQTFENHYTQVPLGSRGPEGPRGYSFYGSRYAQSIPSILPGPGIFYAPRRGVSKQACFQNYLVDVSKYVPTEEEKRIIKSQNQALEVTIPREEPLPDDEDLDYDLDPELFTRGTVSIFQPTKTPIYIEPDFNKHQRIQFRQKRAAPSSRKQTDLIDQAALLSAVSNDKDCNVILRGSSERLVALLTRENPVKLTSLRLQASLQRS